MVIKYSILIFSFLISFTSLAIKLNPSAYRQEAHNWVTTFVVSPQKKLTMNCADLQVCANLFYFSYLRSAATLKAQDIACKTMESMWHGWQNIAQTRMNPSVDLPYHIDFDKQEILYKEFIKAQSYHRSIGQSYAHIAEAAVKENYLTPYSQEAVLIARERSREVVALAFLEIKKILGDMLEFASSNLRSEWIDWDEQESLRFDLLDTLSGYIPYFAVKSFIEIERVNTQASEQSWNVVSTICGVSKQMWEAIEIARASYYVALYQELLDVMQEYKIDPLFMRIMVDHQGIINPEHQESLLPYLS